MCSRVFSFDPRLIARGKENRDVTAKICSGMLFVELQRLKMATRVRCQILMIAVLALACMCLSFFPVHAQAALPPTPEMQELQVSLPDGGADTAPAPAQGIRGKAWHFDGENDFLPLSIDRQMQPLQAWSLACWLKLDDLPGPATHTLLSWREKKGDETRLFVLRPEFKGRNYRFGFDHKRTTILTDDPDHLAPRITPTITSEMWYHLGLTVGDGRVVFYVDGVPVYQERVEEAPALSFDAGRIGTDLAGGAAFAGIVDVIRISPSELTADQMSEIYLKDLGEARLAANREQLLADFPDARRISKRQIATTLRRSIRRIGIARRGAGTRSSTVRNTKVTKSLSLPHSTLPTRKEPTSFALGWMMTSTSSRRWMPCPTPAARLSFARARIT